jgi:hypothetical protein
MQQQQHCSRVQLLTNTAAQYVRTTMHSCYSVTVSVGLWRRLVLDTLINVAVTVTVIWSVNCYLLLSMLLFLLLLLTLAHRVCS